VTRHIVRPEARERGSILVFALFLIVLLAVIGIALINTAGRDRIAAAQAATRERAFACAEAGLQYGRRFFGREYEASHGWNDYLNPTAASYKPGYKHPPDPDARLSTFPKQVRGASDGSTYDTGTLVDGSPQFWVSIRDDDDERPNGIPIDDPAKDNNETVILRSECTAFYYTERGQDMTAAVEALMVHVQNASGYGNAQTTSNAPDVVGRLGTD
jgi:Tfp pilus assembly protein PilX